MPILTLEYKKIYKFCNIYQNEMKQSFTCRLGWLAFILRLIQKFQTMKSIETT